jgi:Ca2+-binding RTX toxin-like protein
MSERLAAAWADGRPSAGPLWQTVRDDWTTNAHECDRSLHADFLWVPEHRDSGQQLLFPPAELEGHEPLVWAQFYRQVPTQDQDGGGVFFDDQDGLAVFFNYDDAWAAALAPAGPPSGHQFLLEWDAPCEEAERFIQQLMDHPLMATLLTASALAGPDVLADAAVIDGRDGADLLTARPAVGRLIGGNGVDTLNGMSATAVDGGPGDDRLVLAKDVFAAGRSLG